tara:strand:- start:503 stop:661 length:159 start_codon:yes stop_codon:yes gene_type:complete
LQEYFSFPNLTIIEEKGHGLSFQMLYGEYGLRRHIKPYKPYEAFTTNLVLFF